MRSFDYQYPVRTYICADGPNAGDVIESPSSSSYNRQSLCAVRNTTSNRVSLIAPEQLPIHRVENGTVADAHGVITQDGWGKAMNPSYCSGGRDGAPLLPYSQGERIWIEESLLPTDEGDLIPVVSLDTGNLFRISSREVCYVPDLAKSHQDGTFQYAATAGPIRSVIVDGQAWKIQGYFQRDTSQSSHAVLKWKKWRTGCSSGGLSEFNPLKDEQERRRVFDNQWQNLCLNSHNEEADRSYYQPDSSQLLSTRPKRDEHLHTPRSRFANSNLSKRALRTANIPYRPLQRRPSESEVPVLQASGAGRVPTATQCPSWCSVIQRDCPSEHSEVAQTAPVTGMEPTQDAMDQSTDGPTPEQESDAPVVVNLKIHFDPTTRHADVSSSQDSGEDYEMV